MTPRRHPKASTMDATPFLPNPGAGKRSHAAAVQDCRGCPLWKNTTQAVFGDGPLKAQIILVGEQPGDREDREGRPFVGPAGRELDRVLELAGIDRSSVYLTNVVKHFKFQERGKRRIHQTPTYGEARACLPWFERELQLVKPRALVTLGATAAQSLLGREFRVTAQHGELIESQLAPLVTATIHPSAILRAPDGSQRRDLRSSMVADLRVVADGQVGEHP